MSNTIQLMPVSSLLEKKFFVPAYQRGFRWTRQQVTDLLEDIYTFAVKKNKAEKEFYCLQPVVVQYHKDQDYYEVVDGQQRLTTIRILLTYFIKEYLNGRSLKQRYGKDLYQITYETRPGLTSFLDAITDSEENIEFFHVSKALQYITEWFTTKVSESGEMYDDLCDSILKTLVYNQKNRKEEGLVQVIWYELSEGNSKPIDTFIRINLGKISLTNAELIKALFLQERNFGEGEAARQKQLEIAQEWDQMEHQLQDENFWWFLNKEENKASSHIEFIFDLMQYRAVEKDKKLGKIIGSDKYMTFRYFNHLFGNEPSPDIIKRNWDSVKNYFDTFREWFEHPGWYHYTGFLIYCNRSVRDLYDLLSDEKIKTKKDATDKLIEEIAKEFNSINWKNIDKRIYLDLSYDDTKKELLRKFFLMFNLEYVVRKSSQQNLIYKFPFKAFKHSTKKQAGVSWDIEHINATTDNALEKKEDQLTWLENALSDVQNMDENLTESIRSFIAGSSTESFEVLYQQVLKLSTDETIDDDFKNRLGNLTLLDAGTNRGYGNALFATKRRKIIEKDRDGIFVPICTKNVFLKYFDGNTRSTWTAGDIEAYGKAMEEIMQPFLKPKPHNLKNEKATTY